MKGPLTGHSFCSVFYIRKRKPQWNWTLPIEVQGWCSAIKMGEGYKVSEEENISMSLRIMWCIFSLCCYLILSVDVLIYCVVNTLGLMGSIDRRLKLQYSWLYMFTGLLLDYMQYFHIVARLLANYILCLTYISLNIALNTALMYICVHTLLPNVLRFIGTVISSWLVSLFCAVPTGLFTGTWLCTIIYIHFKISYDLCLDRCTFEHINPSLHLGDRLPF